MKGVVSWFAGNRVAANLLMITLLFGGAMTLTTVKQELFPEIAPSIITVSTVYPGEPPESIEEGITVKIEEAVYGIEGVKHIESRSTTGVSVVTIETEEGADRDEILNDVKSRVDAIATLPEDAERPVAVKVELPQRVLSLALWGKTDSETIQTVAENVRDEIARLREISRVEISNSQDYEVAVSVSEETLRRHGLTFDQVADAIRRSSVDVAGGTIKAESGEFQLRTKTRAYVRKDFEKIPVLTRADGTSMTLGEIAVISDGFAEATQQSLLDGKPAKIIDVYMTGDQSLPAVTGAVHKYIAEAKTKLPQGIEIATWKDASKMYDDRLDLVTRNGLMSLILVFAILALFLQFRLAVWVTIGLPIAMLGAIWLMPALDVSINLLSLFSFILVLGILVDDAIVVSENIHYRVQKGEYGIIAARKGVLEVALPVVLAVTTTIAAFIPMATIPGVTGQFTRSIPLVVILCLVFSLVESVFILPSHLAHYKPIHLRKRAWGPFGYWQDFQGVFERGMEWFANHLYRPVLIKAMRWRYLTLAIGISGLILVAGMVKGGVIKQVFFPPIEGDQVFASLTMPPGTPVEVTAKAVAALEASAAKVRAEYDAKTETSVFKHTLASIGAQPEQIEKAWMKGNSGDFSAEHLGAVSMELIPAEQRTVTSAEVLKRWRELTPPIPDVIELSFDAALTHAGKPIEIDLKADDPAVLRAAADKVKAKLAEYPGVFDITDTMRPGKRELELTLTESGRALGLSEAELGKQARQAFYGEEAQRLQRGKHDVKVMVRYPLDERRTLANLAEMRVRTRDGAEIALGEVATISIGRGDSAIERSGRIRSVTVIADLDFTKSNANEIMASLNAAFFPEMQREYPNLHYSFEGEQKNQAESMGGMMRGTMLAMFMIFAILALGFGSFLQPLIVMFAIPFGLAGAILAHWMLGLPITLLSVIGMLAMAGVAVNDSMVMISFINRYRQEGHSMFEAVIEAGPRRFRAIMLTSMTTFAGLGPIILEKSVQAQFIVPMAVSLAFGVMFATVITLFIVPAAYLVLYDGIKRGVSAVSAVLRRETRMQV